MNHYFYPAIFHSCEEGGYWISFPDFPECMSQGETLAEAYEMAADALGLCIDEKIRTADALPPASSPTDYTVEAGDFSCLVEFDLMEYRRKHATKSVKKTLTIPEWLNEAAIAKNLNFSQVLQEALIQRLGD